MSSGTNERSGLSPKARALLDAARDVDSPTKADRDRVRRALGVALVSAGTVGATVSAATGAKAIAGTASSAATAGAVGSGAAAGASVATAGASIATAGLFTKVAIAVVAIGVSSSALVAVHHYATTLDPTVSVETTQAPSEISLAPMRASETAAPMRAQDTPAGATPADVTAATPTDGTATTDTAIREAEIATPSDDGTRVADAMTVRPSAAPHPTTATAHRPRTPRTAVSGDDESIDRERAVMAEMVHASPARLLELVDAHDEQFPIGQLSIDRDQQQARAVHGLCAEGPDAVARWLAAHPQSPSARLVRATCPAP